MKIMLPVRAVRLRSYYFSLVSNPSAALAWKVCRSLIASVDYGW